MKFTSFNERRELARLGRDALCAFQLAKLNRLLEEVVPHNPFYARKLADFPHHLQGLEELEAFPYTAKQELHPEPGGGQRPQNLSFDMDKYVRFHQTSGTRGRPLTVLDTADDWAWWIECWQYVLDAAEITAKDRVVLAFSFGPFIGFWSAFDALVSRGAMAIPAGGMSTLARIELMRRTDATAIFCTPTYALHMAEVAAEHKINLAHLSVEKIVVAGEPGGSVPAIRERIETAWGVRVCDHSGASEVGAWGFADARQRGLHVLESEFIAEFIGAESGKHAESGELSHLVLTTLGRAGCPVIRYRTGDLVRPVWPEEGDCRFVVLEGGVLARADDMMVIRGVNIFPSSIEQILHGFPEVAEYRMTASTRGAMDQLLIEVEDHLSQPERIAEELRLQLGLHVEVRCVPALTLPRFEGKGKRFVDERSG